MTREQFTELVERAQAGDKRAFDRIFRIYEGKLRTYISQHINDKSQADDALQNTFINVYNNIGQLRSVDGFKSWLYRIAHNECMAINNAVKKQQERSFSLYADYGDEDGGSLAEQIEDTSIELPEDFATNAELQKLLAGTLNSLPKKQRECLILYYYQQKPVKEIAETLGVSESTVKTNKSKALDTLRRKLEKYRKSYNFAFAPMGLFLNKLVGTGKVKSAYIGTAVVHTAGAGLVTAGVIGVMGFAGLGYLHYHNEIKPDQNDLPDHSIVIEDKADSEDILKEYEMPDELKNLEWEEQQFDTTESNPFAFANSIAKSVPLIEDGIDGLKMLILSDCKYNSEKGIIQFVFDPICSAPEDYIMLEPSINIRTEMKLNEPETFTGKIYIENEKVIFSFETIGELRETFKEQSLKHILNNFPTLNGYCFVSAYKKGEIDNHDPMYDLGFSYSGDNPFRATINGTVNNRENEGFSFYSSALSHPNASLNHQSTCVLYDDGSIILDCRANCIPKLYLGNYDENGVLLTDPYGQKPYERIKQIKITEAANSSSTVFEIINGLLYDKLSRESDNTAYKLLWLPPDTHYTELHLPDHLTGYYSDEALQRLNADHIYLGADSGGFVEQLEQSQDEKVRAILAQIREDNNLY